MWTFVLAMEAQDRLMFLLGWELREIVCLFPNLPVWGHRSIRSVPRFDRGAQLLEGPHR